VIAASRKLLSSPIMGCGGRQLRPAVTAAALEIASLRHSFAEFPALLARSDNAGGSFTFTAKENVDTIKGRFNYPFSIH
jgi:hypothetical protein